MSAPTIEAATDAASMAIDKFIEFIGPAYESFQQMRELTQKNIIDPVYEKFESAPSLAPFVASVQWCAEYAAIAAFGAVLMAALYVIVRSSSASVQSGPSVIARHILIEHEESGQESGKSEWKCQELKKMLARKKGDDSTLLDYFGELAVKHSDCSSAMVGGALGNIGPGKMGFAFDKVAWNAPLRVVQGPVKLENGWSLILVLQRSGKLQEDDAETKKKKEK